MGNHSELHDPDTFLEFAGRDSQRLLFLPNLYASYKYGVSLQDMWEPQGRLEDHPIEGQKYNLHLSGKVNIKAAALYAWFVAATHRKFVSLQYGGAEYTTRYFSEKVEHDADSEAAKRTALLLFGEPSVRSHYYDPDLIASAPFRIHLSSLHDPEKPYTQTALESDREWALPRAVAGAVTMLNEIEFGVVPADPGSGVIS